MATLVAMHHDKLEVLERINGTIQSIDTTTTPRSRTTSTTDLDEVTKNGVWELQECVQTVDPSLKS